MGSGPTKTATLRLPFFIGRSPSRAGIEQFANPFTLAIGQGLLEGAEQLIQVQFAAAKGALEGVELALQGVEAGALGAVCQLDAGGIDGLGQRLARGFLAQGLHQRPHEVVDGGAVLLAIGVIDAQPLEQALDCGGQALFLRQLLRRLGFGTLAPCIWL